MLAQLFQNPVLVAAGVFVVGWILGSISSRIGARNRANRRDPRDDRIRSMDAELRIAKTNADEAAAKIESLEMQLKQAADDIVKRDAVISHQQQTVEVVKKDLKDSVKKTRELRHELTDRATENVKSEVKLREVETELSVVHASTDMIATGVLDYTEAPSKPDETDVIEPAAAAKASKAPR